MSNLRLASGVALTLVLCLSACGGEGGDGGSAAPDAGGKPVGAGHEGQPGKRARGGPIDVPDINLVGSSIAEVKAALGAAIRPQCPGNTLCVNYAVADTDQGPCYGGELSYQKPLLPGGTITIHAGQSCSTPGVGDTDEPPETPPVPVDPPTSPSSAPS